ncbi:ALG11 mannosyltransferase [Gracilaria domingensis]|nr:ALG11 mannosyltransferase [Gracilaria domingensis]
MVSHYALIASAVLLVLLALLGFRKNLRRKRKDLIKLRHRSRSIGFLHPHSLDGGGGERVLWCALLAVKDLWPHSHIVVYSAWNSAGVSVSNAVAKSRQRVRLQFGIDLSGIDFEPIDISELAPLVDGARYSRFTLLLQALGALRVGAKAYAKQPVELLVDTTNQSFALIVPKLLGAETMTYVHYPTISTDMLSLVRSRKKQFNNDSSIASSRMKTIVKVGYYKLFAKLYGFNSRFVDIKVANSSWTASHLRALWKGHIHRIFPPCKLDLELNDAEREHGLIVSLGQFRAEKNHELQLQMMRVLREKYPDVKCRLVMIGGARNEKDRERAVRLRQSAEKERLPVTVRVNVSNEELLSTLKQGWLGVHTMRDEHFGISVVELQAHGLVVVAHRSGGVETDIVRDGRNGFLVRSAEEYADAVVKVLCDDELATRVRGEGRKGCSRFAGEMFCTRFSQVIDEHFRV